MYTMGEEGDNQNQRYGSREEGGVKREDSARGEEKLYGKELRPIRLTRPATGEVDNPAGVTPHQPI